MLEKSQDKPTPWPKGHFGLQSFDGETVAEIEVPAAFLLQEQLLDAQIRAQLLPGVFQLLGTWLWK